MSKKAMEEVLKVTQDGEFIWHPDADRLIEEGDYGNSPAMQHILRALRAKQEQGEPVIDKSAAIRIATALGWEPKRKPLTDAMVSASARVLSDRQAQACGVDKDDQWKIYGQDFIEDARAMLEAAHGIKE